MNRNIEGCLQFSLVRIGQQDAMQKSIHIPNLENNTIHLWTARYSDLDLYYQTVSDFISQKEQEKASTFRKSADVRHYILRHGMLRFILGTYTLSEPRAILLVTGKNGKPELDPLGASADVSFNLSQTSEMVLIGVTKKRRIGVDIVKIESSYRFHDHAEYIFTPGEKACLQKIKPELRSQVFFRIWALKEAILKATGKTLAMMEKTDLSEIIKDVLISPEYSMKFLGTHPPLFICQFNIGSGHHGAIAVDVGN